MAGVNVNLNYMNNLMKMWMSSQGGFGLNPFSFGNTSLFQNNLFPMDYEYMSMRGIMPSNNFFIPINNFMPTQSLAMPDFNIFNNYFKNNTFNRKLTYQNYDLSYRTTSYASNRLFASSRYDAIINKYAKKENIDPNLIKAIIQKESHFNPNAGSGAGAAGLMQLMPATARGLGVTNRRDPEQSIRGGTKLLGRLLRKYDGNVKSALAAYNSGEGSVEDYLKGTNKTGKNPKHKKTANGVPTFKETQEYVPNIISLWKRANALEKANKPKDTEGA